MVRRRVKVRVRVRGWRLLGRVCGWAKVRARLTPNSTLMWVRVRVRVGIAV